MPTNEQLRTNCENFAHRDLGSRLLDFNGSRKRSMLLKNSGLTVAGSIWGMLLGQRLTACRSQGILAIHTFTVRSFISLFQQHRSFTRNHPNGTIKPSENRA